MKQCSVCLAPVGRNSRKLLCTTHRVKKWVQENRERSNNIKLAYVKRHKDNRIESIKKYKEANRQRVNAWAVLQYHVSNGDIEKPVVCSKCKLQKELHAHHPDISRPLDVVWVCALCHKGEHGYEIGVVYA